ncbi:MAG: hypothetical protein ACYTGB_09220 [Planctomycetota bacterium]
MTRESPSSSGSRRLRIAVLLLCCAVVGGVAGSLLQRWRTSRLRAEAAADRERVRRELGEMRRRIESQAPPRRRVDPRERAAGMRSAHTAAARAAYARVVADARKACRADDASWEKAAEVFKRHFGPMETELAAFEKSSGWRPPDPRRVVGPRVAGTLEELRAALGEEAWKRFDAWRRPPPQAAQVWRLPRCTYFLLPEEYAAVNLAAASALRWNLMAANFKALRGRLALPEGKRSELEAILRDHLDRFTAAVGGPGGERPPDADARVREALKLTEEKLLRLLGKEKFAAYGEWKAALTGPARIYFHPGAETPAE